MRANYWAHVFAPNKPTTGGFRHSDLEIEARQGLLSRTQHPVLQMYELNDREEQVARKDHIGCESIMLE